MTIELLVFIGMNISDVDGIQDVLVPVPNSSIVIYLNNVKGPCIRILPELSVTLCLY